MLFFEASEEEMQTLGLLDQLPSLVRKRLLGRSATSAFTEMESGRGTGGRVDDNLESIRKRFATYEKDGAVFGVFGVSNVPREETRPIVDKYKKMDMVFNVDAMQDVDHVPQLRLLQLVAWCDGLRYGRTHWQSFNTLHLAPILKLFDSLLGINRQIRALIGTISK